MGRLSQAESRQLTRKRLIDSAAKVFAEKGFASASLEEIAESAGYTRGALYYNFADKDELFLAVLDQSLQAEIELIGDLIKHAEDPAQFVGSLRERPRIGARSAGAATRWSQLCDEFRLYALRNESARQKLAQHERHMRDAYADGVIGVLRRMGVPPPAPPDHLGSMIMALDQGLQRQERIDPSAVPDGLFFELLVLLLRAAQALHDVSPP
jgi:AcrR family transcriptional regulator